MRKGTAVRKTYQNEEIDTSQPAVPEAVSVALGELAGELREGLLALAVGTGLQVMSAMMEADVTAPCGPKGRHDTERTATRHGHERGSVSLGGRRVPVERPRMRAIDGSGEVAVPSYGLFSQTEVLGRMAMERMLVGLSTRRYPVGLEPVGARTEQTARSTSKSAVSRRFVAATGTALGELLAADLSGLDLVAIMVDGGTSVSTSAWSPSGSASTARNTALAGRGLHRERHPGARAAGRVSRTAIRAARACPSPRAAPPHSPQPDPDQLLRPVVIKCPLQARPLLYPPLQSQTSGTWVKIAVEVGQAVLILYVVGWRSPGM